MTNERLLTEEGFIKYILEHYGEDNPDRSRMINDAKYLGVGRITDIAKAQANITEPLADLLENAGYGVTRGAEETLAKIKELGEANNETA